MPSGLAWAGIAQWSPSAGSFNGFHPNSKFLAIILVSRNQIMVSILIQFVNLTNRRPARGCKA
jgi:hypothetical protein